MMHFPSYKSALSQQGHACNTHSCRSPKVLSALAIILQSFVCVSAHLPCKFHPVSHAAECVRHRLLWARVMTERTWMRMPCHGIALHRKLHPMRPDTAAVTGCQGHWITTAFLFTHPVPKKRRLIKRLCVRVRPLLSIAMLWTASCRKGSGRPSRLGI